MSINTVELTNLNIYFNSDKCRIFYTEGPCWSDTKFVSNLINTDYIFFQFTWNIEAQSDQIPWDMEKKVSINNNFNFKTNIIFCAPTEKLHNVFKDKGYTSILLNHNCLLDYNKYTLKTENESERQYNAVINSRPFWWKRVYLASNVDKLLYIKGNDWAKDETSWNGYKFMNLTLKSDISQHTVNDLYNSSKLGLILSGNTGENQQGLNEGANYSSSEYLLCGLPVVSTESQGGRDYWFDDYNSIICEPNDDSVKKSVDTMLEKLSNGEIDREKIRNTQIKKMNLMRENFINETQKIFNTHGVNVDAKQFFKDNYFHKMCDYSLKNYDAFIKT